MSVSTGLYSIRSAAFSQPFVSRAPFETADLSPKAILSLPADDNASIEWVVENLGDSRYVLSNRGAPTAVINDLVFAILETRPFPERWNLEQLPQYGDNQYLIHTNNGTTGWVLPGSNDLTQVQSKPLIVYPTDPPKYPANERWIIEALD